eukprot:scaffold751_cov395-Prasinococcus_capsulatus_cf.AAC.6
MGFNLPCRVSPAPFLGRPLPSPGAPITAKSDGPRGRLGFTGAPCARAPHLAAVPLAEPWSLCCAAAAAGGGNHQRHHHSSSYADRRPPNKAPGRAGAAGAPVCL